MKRPEKAQNLAVILWVASTLFFSFQFILRMIPALLIDQVMKKYNVNTQDFGNLASAYYLGYAGMQIPLGILMDRFNFRYVSFLAIVVAIIGNLVFTCADNWYIAIFGRFLIGAGSAIGFLGVAKIIKVYFNEKYHKFMIGLSFTFGLMGAVFGNKPMVEILNNYPVSNVLIALSFVGLLIGIIILLIKGEEKEIDSIETITQTDHNFSIKQIIFNPIILIVGISGGLMVGALEGFADLWSLKYFSQILGFSKEDSSFANSFFFVGMCVGGPILANLSDYLKSDVVVIMFCAITIALIFIILFYFTQHWSLNLLSSIMFILGIVCCYQILVFSFVSSLVDKSVTGMSIAVANCMNMSFGMFFHKIISILIQYNYNSNMDNDACVIIYDYQAFVIALSVIPICALLGQFGFLYVSYKLNNKKD